MSLTLWLNSQYVNWIQKVIVSTWWSWLLELQYGLKERCIIVLSMLQLDPSAEVEHCSTSSKSLHNFGLGDFFSLMRFHAKKRSVFFSRTGMNFLACIIIICVLPMSTTYMYITDRQVDSSYICCKILYHITSNFCLWMDIPNRKGVGLS